MGCVAGRIRCGGDYKTGRRRAACDDGKRGVAVAVGVDFGCAQIRSALAVIVRRMIIADGILKRFDDEFFVRDAVERTLHRKIAVTHVRALGRRIILEDVGAIVWVFDVVGGETGFAEIDAQLGVAINRITADLIAGTALDANAVTGMVGDDVIGNLIAAGLNENANAVVWNFDAAIRADADKIICDIVARRASEN